MRVYLDFIRRRATGELQTGAEWMRTFVKAHPGELLSAPRRHHIASLAASSPTSLIPLLRLLARLSRHRSRRPRPPPRVRRHWRGPPSGARAVGAAVYTTAAHRRRLVRAPLLGGARRIHPPRLCPRPRLTARIHPRAPLCRYVPLGRAGDRSFKMKSKERHALLARYAARFNRPRDEAPPSKAGGDCGCD